MYVFEIPDDIEQTVDQREKAQNSICLDRNTSLNFYEVQGQSAQVFREPQNGLERVVKLIAGHYNRASQTVYFCQFLIGMLLTSDCAH